MCVNSDPQGLLQCASAQSTLAIIIIFIIVHHDTNNITVKPL